MPIDNMPKAYLLKRLFDFSLALIGLTLSFPIWSLIVFLVWLEGGRPIFYLQERVGKNSVLFQTIKFRTMGYRKNNSKLAKFLRRTALDEFPQLINIIKGQMSFVGPRPLIAQELEVSEQFKLRTAVSPGLTGLAQLLLAKDAPVQKKLDYDITYIEKQNIALDILLILRSFWVSFGRKWDSLNNASK